MNIFIGIDGTGPGSDRTYEARFGTAFSCAHSHVARLATRFGPFGRVAYSRGPTWPGFQTLPMANNTRAHARSAFQQALLFEAGSTKRITERIQEAQLRSHLMQGGVSVISKAPDPILRIWLAGYSRGGAAAIEAAWMLQDRGIPVQALFLFDAVERTLYRLRTKTIPANVRSCFHARRDPGVGSRSGFGNCGTEAERGVRYVERTFFGTHGAIGGLPWSEDAATRDGSIDRKSVV